MKVLIVSKALTSAAYRRKLVALARFGVDVHAAVPPAWREGKHDRDVEYGTEDAYNLIVTPLRLNGHFHLHHYPELGPIADKIRPDLIHLDEEAYNLATYLGSRVAAQRGIPSVFFTWQNIPRAYPPPFRQLERRVYRSSLGAIAGNREAGAVLRRKGYEGRIAIIPQFGVDPDAFAPADHVRPGFTIGFLNRLVPAKGPQVMLDAFAAVPAGCRLRFVGDGSLEPVIRREIGRRGWEERVTIERRVASTDMPELLNQLDVVVLPSLTTSHWKEQFGRILVEAMACGVAVVGSDSGEISNVIGDAGIVVPEGDAAALANALTELYESRELRNRLGVRGRQRVLAHYTHAGIARSTAAYYERLLAD